jgi:hypothetical protein
MNGCQNLKHIQIYAQMIWLEEYSGSKLIQLLNTVGVCPEILTITIRYSDWRWWEYGQRLRLEHGWESKLLNWQAHPRLREIRLQLEIVERQFGETKDKISELRTIEMDLRSKYCTVNKVDLFGTPVRVVLDDPDGASSSEAWSGRAPFTAGGHQSPKVPTDFKITNFVWKANQDKKSFEQDVGPATESNEPGSFMDANLPILNIDQSRPPGSMSSLSESEKEESSKYEQEWSKRGSLLKFARGA